MRAPIVSILTIFASGLMVSNSTLVKQIEFTLVKPTDSALINPSLGWPLEDDWAVRIFGEPTGPSYRAPLPTVHGPVIMNPSATLRFKNGEVEHQIEVHHEDAKIKVSNKSSDPHTIAIYNEYHNQLLVVHVGGHNTIESIKNHEPNLPLLSWQPDHPTSVYRIGDLQSSSEGGDFTKGVLYPTPGPHSRRRAGPQVG